MSKPTTRAARAPRIQATYEVWSKLWAYIGSTTKEIGGFGHSLWVPELNTIRWMDIYLVDQVTGPGHIDYKGDWIGRVVERAEELGVLGEANHVVTHWHSHANMSVFHSDTDEDLIDGLRATGIPHLLSIVGNRKCESTARIDSFNVPLLGHVAVEKLPLGLEAPAGMWDEIEASLEQHILPAPKPAPKPKPAPPAKPSKNGKHPAKPKLSVVKRTTDDVSTSDIDGEDLPDYAWPKSATEADKEAIYDGKAIEIEHAERGDWEDHGFRTMICSDGTCVVWDTVLSS